MLSGSSIDAALVTDIDGVAVIETDVGSFCSAVDGSSEVSEVTEEPTTLCADKIATLSTPPASTACWVKYTLP